MKHAYTNRYLTQKISCNMFSSGLVHIVCVLMAVNVWVFIRDSMWEKCARLSHPRAFKGNIKFTQLSQNLISQWWRTSWRNLIFEGNNLLICFQFETFNFVKICQKLFWFWAARIISQLVETASSCWGVSPNPKTVRIGPVQNVIFLFKKRRLSESLATRGEWSANDWASLWSSS